MLFHRVVILSHFSQRSIWRCACTDNGSDMPTQLTAIVYTNPASAQSAHNSAQSLCNNWVEATKSQLCSSQIRRFASIMPTIDCENVRQEVTKCLEQTQAFKNVRIIWWRSYKQLNVHNYNKLWPLKGLSVKEILSLPELEFPSECQDVKKAFDDCLRSAVSISYIRGRSAMFGSALTDLISLLPGRGKIVHGMRVPNITTIDLVLICQ